jgi:hypothetical protein
MFKRSFKPLLVCLSLSCMPLMANALETSTVSCSNGNFLGEARVHLSVNGLSGAYVTDYKITKNNNQKGGNKANIKFYVLSESGPITATKSSPDNLKQDGQWHSFSLREMGVVSANPNPYMLVEFVFDKPGKDPKCSVIYKMPK